MERLILETTFLIDLEREAEGGLHGQAARFLEANGRSNFYITFTIAGELAAGSSMHRRDTWAQLIGPFHVLGPNGDVEWHYGRLFGYLRDIESLIGTNDLWIAATALAYGMPLVTRNVERFRLVPGLDVAEYGG